MFTPAPVDRHVGSRIQATRQKVGLTEGQFAKLIGVPEKKISAFESGKTRVDAATLFEMGRAFDVPVATFFENE